MRMSPTFLAPVALSIAAFLLPQVSLRAEKEPDPAQVTIAVASLLEQVHFSKQRLNKDVSRKLLRNFLETLDYNHLFFSL